MQRAVLYRYNVAFKLVCLLAFMLVLMLTSCEHKELCYHHPHTARVRIDVNWDKFDKEEPTGMTVMVYPHNGDEAIRHITNTTTHATLDLKAGLYHTIVFNQTPAEFSSVSFVDMGRYSTAKVKANYATSRWFEKRSEEDSLVMEPEWVAADFQANSEVTPAMVEITGMKNLELLRGYAHRAGDFVIATHSPENFIHQIFVKVHLNGIYNLLSARASLSGLADSYFLKEERNSNTRVTQLMESWNMQVDPVDPTKGTITGKISSIGLPSNHKATAEENEFILSVLLVDGETIIDIPFYVGDLLKKRYDKSGKFKLEYELELWVDDPLPDVKPTGSGNGGFDVSVDDWGPVENIPLDV